eukprot:30202-Pelagococcus_subviridis.AAC.6
MTNEESVHSHHSHARRKNSSNRGRTDDLAINSRTLYQLSYGPRRSDASDAAAPKILTAAAYPAIVIGIRCTPSTRSSASASARWSSHRSSAHARNVDASMSRSRASHSRSVPAALACEESSSSESSASPHRSIHLASDALDDARWSPTMISASASRFLAFTESAARGGRREDAVGQRGRLSDSMMRRVARRITLTPVREAVAVSLTPPPPRRRGGDAPRLRHDDARARVELLL